MGYSKRGGKLKYAILSDIHANLTALEAALKDIEDKGAVLLRPPGARSKPNV